MTDRVPAAGSSPGRRRSRRRIREDLLVLLLLLVTTVVLVGLCHVNMYAAIGASAILTGGAAAWQKLRQT